MFKTVAPYLALSLLFSLLLSCNIVERQELRGATLVVTNGTVIDGTGADPIPDGLVALQGNHILAVGEASDFKIPDDVPIVDAGGGTILPGIINAHAHRATSAATRRILFLLDGVTSVCDLGTQLMHMPHLEEKGIQAGPAARGFKAGPIVTVPGGYPDPPFLFIDYDVEGAHEAEMAIRDLHDRRADYIKVALEPGIFGDPWPVLSLDELRAIVTTAHELDLLVRAHVNNAKLDVALEGGVDIIEHVPMPSFTYEDLAPMFDGTGEFHLPPELEAQLQRAVDQGIVLVPTLDVIIDGSYWEGEMDPDTEGVTQAVLAVVRFFHEAGGTIAVGNDYGNPGIDTGMPLSEMHLLHAVGLSPMEIIEAATRHAAFVCGHGEELGTLEPGKLADLIVVAGDPLDDLDALDEVLYVVLDGEVVLSPEEGE